jgi:cellulose synthase/poly-beta-1,6-N-acetylglucosamine synthase-like glycosyltransferase
MDKPYHYGQLRFWEMFPGLLVWGTFFLAIALTFVVPIWVIAFIIVFDLLWLFRVIYFNIFVVQSWKRLRKTREIDWQVRLGDVKGSDEIYHLIFLPTYKEEYQVIQSTIRSLKQNAFPNKRMIVVLGGEEGDKVQFMKNAHRIESEFGGVFFDLIWTVHPKGLEGEIPGKGSNLNWMGNRVVEILDEKYPQIADEHLVVSAFDVDTIAHPQYFSYLTHQFCTVENPLRCSYQPIALFSNNIWTAKAPVRVGAFGTTFWLFGELARPDRLWTFSSHSMPWVMLKDVGFWQKDIVSEDSRIFMQAFLHYHGDYRVEPLHLPVSMDAVSGEGYWDSLKALYGQMRRWAWGVEHLPYLIDGFSRDKTIPKRKKFKYFFNHVEGMYTWATAPVIMFLLGWFPLLVAKGQNEALVQAAPFTLEQLMQLAMIGIFVSAIMSLTLLPRRPKQIKKHTWAIMLLQWALLPITFIVFGSFPAVDAQTRLMTGRYLGFNVTKKVRK